MEALAAAVSFAGSYFAGRISIAGKKQENSEELVTAESAVKKLVVSSVVKGVVTHQRDYGVILDIDGAVGFCQMDFAPGAPYTIGTEVQCVSGP